MMRKLLPLLLIIFLASCTDGKKQENGTVENIKSYEKINTYFFNKKEGWLLKPEYQFNIPKDGNKLLSIYGGMGMKNNNNIDYYSLRTGKDKGWKRNNDYDFMIESKGEIIPMFAGIGIRNGKKIEYYAHQQKGKGWKRNTAYDVDLPNSNSEFIAMYNGYSIKNKNKLNFYTFQFKNKGWKRTPEKDFTIPDNKDFISFHEHLFFGGLGVVNGNNLEFYTVGKAGWKRKPEMDFNLTDINKSEIISVSGGIGILK